MRSLEIYFRNRSSPVESPTHWIGSEDNTVWDEEDEEEDAEEVVDNEFETDSEGKEEQ